MAEGGMFDMLKRARDLQKRMSKIQKRVEKQVVSASSGGGMVTVEISGKLQVRKISIEPALLKDADAKMVQDLVTSAVNAAISKAQQMVTDEMKEVTGGLNIPGMS